MFTMSSPAPASSSKPKPGERALEKIMGIMNDLSADHTPFDASLATPSGGGTAMSARQTAEPRRDLQGAPPQPFLGGGGGGGGGGLGATPRFSQEPTLFMPEQSVFAPPSYSPHAGGALGGGFGPSAQFRAPVPTPTRMGGGVDPLTGGSGPMACFEASMDLSRANFRIQFPDTHVRYIPFYRLPASPPPTVHDLLLHAAFAINQSSAGGAGEVAADDLQFASSMGAATAPHVLDPLEDLKDALVRAKAAITLSQPDDAAGGVQVVDELMLFARWADSAVNSTGAQPGGALGMSGAVAMADYSMSIDPATGSTVGRAVRENDFRRKLRPEEVAFHKYLEEHTQYARPASVAVDPSSLLKNCSGECLARAQELREGHRSLNHRYVAHGGGGVGGGMAGVGGGFGPRGGFVRPSTNTGAAAVSARAELLYLESSTWTLLGDLVERVPDLDHGVTSGGGVGGGGHMLGDEAKAADLTDCHVEHQLTNDHAAEGGLLGGERHVGYDSSVVRHRIVRQWLERMYRHAPNLKPPEERASYWKNTHGMLAQKKSKALGAFGGQSGLQPHSSPVSSSDVAALDPDAPLRHSMMPGVAAPHHWHRLAAADRMDDDHNDELILLLDIWKEIRTGDLQSAINMCLNRQSYWRAALLQGGNLHKPATPYDAPDDEEDGGAAGFGNGVGGGSEGGEGEDWGNPERALWLSTCWDLGRKALAAAAAGVGAGKGAGDDVALMEALIMSTLAGDLDTMLSAMTKLSYGGSSAASATGSGVGAGGAGGGASWEDRCWAHFNCMEAAAIAQCLHRHHKRQEKVSLLYPATATHVLSAEQRHVGEVQRLLSLNLADIFTAHGPLSWEDHGAGSGASASASMSTHESAAASIHHMVQAAAICGRGSLEALLHDDNKRQRLLAAALGGGAAGTAGGESESVLLPQIQRFGAHLIIFLREVLGLSDDDTAGDDVVVAYVDHLVGQHQVELVALYTSHIKHRATRLKKYVGFMKDVRDETDRRTCIKLAKEYFEDDVFEITTATVDAIRIENSPSAAEGHAGADAGALFNPSGKMAGDVLATEAAVAGSFGIDSTKKSIEVASTDMIKIRSIPWLCYEPEHKAEAVRQANLLLCQFFGSGPWKLDAAKLLIERFLDQEAMQCVKQYALTTDYEPLNRHHAEWARVLKEHRCWLAFLKANDAYEDWHTLLLHKQREQDALERYEERYGQPGGGGHHTGYVPLQAAYPRSAREVQQPTDEETRIRCVIEAKHFGDKTWEHVQLQATEVRRAQMDAEDALLMVLDFDRKRWGDLLLAQGEAEAMDEALVSPKGWMVVGPDDEEHADVYTSSHYALIRQRCLPVVIIWLHKVLLDTGRWFKKAAERMRSVASETTGLKGKVLLLEKEAANIFRQALQVADLVASREYKLYAVLQSPGSDDHHLQVLLKQLNESAIELLALRKTISLDKEP